MNGFELVGTGEATSTVNLQPNNFYYLDLLQLASSSINLQSLSPSQIQLFGMQPFKNLRSK